MPILRGVACLLLVLPAFGAHPRAPANIPGNFDVQATRPSGWAGLRVDEVTPDFAAAAGLDRASGARVTQVVPGGPAARAGLLVDDVVVEADGYIVDASVVLPKIARSKMPGESLHLKVWRQRRLIEFELTLGTVPDSTAATMQTATDACTLSVCPVCTQAQLFFGQSPNRECTECLRSRSADISACIQSRLDDRQAASAPAAAEASAQTMPPLPSPPEPVAPPSAPATPAALTITSLALRPASVTSGSRFTIEFGYASPPGDRVEFTFAISAQGRDLFTSDPETLESGAGAAKNHTCSMEASNPGTYRVRIRLTQGDEAVERSATLTVTAR
jgi:hypothetical protein